MEQSNDLLSRGLQVRVLLGSPFYSGDMVELLTVLIAILLGISIIVNIKLFLDLKDYRVFTDILVQQLMELDPEENEEESSVFEAQIIPFRGKPDKEDP